MFDVSYSIITANSTLTHLRTDIALDSFCPDGLVGIGVPVGTDTFVRNFVTKTCRNTIDDVEKLDSIQDGFIHFQDGFIHFQLLRFCQANRLQFIYSHIMLNNRCVLHQLDCKISDTFLKRVPNSTLTTGTRLARPGHTWSFTCRMLRGVMG